MFAYFYDLSLVDHCYFVSVFDGGQTMGYYLYIHIIFNIHIKDKVMISTCVTVISRKMLRMYMCRT